jgi:hypothetical protein
VVVSREVSILGGGNAVVFGGGGCGGKDGVFETEGFFFRFPCVTPSSAGGGWAAADGDTAGESVEELAEDFSRDLVLNLELVVVVELLLLLLLVVILVSVSTIL